MKAQREFIVGLYLLFTGMILALIGIVAFGYGLSLLLIGVIFVRPIIMSDFNYYYFGVLCLYIAYLLLFIGDEN